MHVDSLAFMPSTPKLSLIEGFSKSTFKAWEPGGLRTELNMNFTFSLQTQPFSEYSSKIHVFLLFHKAFKAQELDSDTLSTLLVPKVQPRMQGVGYGWGPERNLGGYFLMNWAVVKSGQVALRRHYSWDLH